MPLTSKGFPLFLTFDLDAETMWTGRDPAYAKRPILPQDCANAIVWLAGDQSGKTTGHVIPVDGGLSEAYLR